MRQITIRGFDKVLAQAIEDLARAEGISRNKAALKLMRRGAGLEAGNGEFPPGAIGHALDKFIGGWTDEQAGEVLRSVAESDAMDLEARRKLGEL